MKFGLTKETIENINSVFETHEEIEEVVIYGSRAKGNFRDGSDIDLTLKGEKITHDLLLKIMNEIDDLDLIYLFDISIFKTINNQNLINHIDRIGQVFYKKLN